MYGDPGVRQAFTTLMYGDPGVRQALTASCMVTLELGRR